MDDGGATIDQPEEVMLPGFRFHPTDEELVEFYLKWKVEQKPLAIQLIRQLDIYKYDPWDLPKLAMAGEKEWYFYCPRDRKYRNSPRPNRVTGAGFWKATGTDRPVYSSDGSKCIGLKKSLVFYRGRAARAMKTDWMMHEFRLPSPPDPSSPTDGPSGRSIPSGNSWAICRIFKRASSTAPRPLPQSLLPSFPGIDDVDQFAFQSSSCATQFGANNGLQQQQQQQQQRNVSYPPDANSYEPGGNFVFSPDETRSLLNVASMIHGMPPTVNVDFGQPQDHDGVGAELPPEVARNWGIGGEEFGVKEIINASIVLI